MKILILSPLFPPDTGTPAIYVKELATRLAWDNETTLLIYGYLPEAVAGVSTHAIDKRSPLPVRLFSFTKALLTQKKYDLVIVNNAPSIEFPLLLVSLFKTITFVLLESDPRAHAASHTGWYGRLHTMIRRRAKKVITLDDETVYTKAEVLPFTVFDENREQVKEQWWKTHCQNILS